MFSALETAEREEFKAMCESIGVEVLTEEEGIELFERQCQKHLGISGKEFLNRWNRGDYAVGEENYVAMHVSMLIPFAGWDYGNE